jgi:hypothetical protein
LAVFGIVFVIRHLKVNRLGVLMLTSFAESGVVTGAGTTHFLNARVPILTLGSLEFKDVLVDFPKEELPGWPPHVGLNLLARGKFILEAPHKRVLFKRY